ncbi:MAG: hypothetical protein JO224_12720 [Pelomonas sp.]|nr:hypothetical protein [Roseateles sp.]
MLSLTPEQQGALEALTLGRDLQRVGAVLARAFPEVDARLGERKGALLDLAWQRARALGLRHALALARYLAAWCVFGAEFENRPGFEWARQLLADTARPEGQRVFQLGRRSREELQRRAAQPNSGLPTPVAFDAALDLLDAELAGHGRLGSLLPRTLLRLGSACDIDAADLTLVESAPLQHYALEQGLWRRVPTRLDAEKLRVLAAQGQHGLPGQLNLLSPSRGARNRLRLRCLAQHVCDPAVHPLVSFNGIHGQFDRRGPLTQDLLLTLPQDDAAPAQADAMAVAGVPGYSRVSMTGCGLRDSGTPLGEQAVRLAVYPSEQSMLAWRRETAPPVRLPAEPLAPPPRALCRVERDGLALDAQRWNDGLAELDRQLADKLPLLLLAWERESGVVNGQLQAEPALMGGTAALTWGWAPHPDGLAAAPFYRVAGQLDLVACELRLRLSGDFAFAGSQSRLTLDCSASEKLQATFERRDAALDVPATIKPAQCAIRQPFVLRVESLAPADRPALLDLAGPVSGAVVGACGLRPRADAPGLEWFCELAVEAVSARFVVNDPLMGVTTMIRPLLPAMKLVSWKLS